MLFDLPEDSTCNHSYQTDHFGIILEGKGGPTPHFISVPLGFEITKFFSLQSPKQAAIYWGMDRGYAKGEVPVRSVGAELADEQRLEVDIHQLGGDTKLVRFTCQPSQIFLNGLADASMPFIEIAGFGQMFKPTGYLAQP